MNKHNDKIGWPTYGYYLYNLGLFDAIDIVANMDKDEDKHFKDKADACRARLNRVGHLC